MTGAITRTILICIVGVLFLVPAKAQKDSPEKSILLAGVVMDLQERFALPFVNVKVKNTYYGTATDISGYFSIFISPGDTLEFSHLGYKDASFIMPFNVGEEQYTLLQLMQRDTMVLEEVVIFPWPEYSNFLGAFLDTPPAFEMEELIIEVKQEISETLNETAKSRYYYNQQRYQKLFRMHDIFPQQNFLDPRRWSDFIQDLTNEEEQ
ncbi:MAG: carboxypeptidase-like regulatory domain-containing protein [Candidatus Cyclobacteriaceae bacterium M2_1C_046]